MIPKFTAKICVKKFAYYLPLEMPQYEFVRFERWLQTFKDDQKVDITIKKHRNNRSDPQNNYYFGVIVRMIVEELKEEGYTKDEAHEALKIRFASYVDPKIGFTRVESTAKMSTERFAEYIEEIKRWAAEYLSLYIPDPDEVE